MALRLICLSELNIKAQSIKQFSGGLNIILTFMLGDTLCM